MDNYFEFGKALVIGVGQYDELSELGQTPCNDASDIAELLVNPKYCGYVDSNVEVLVEKKATKVAIVGALQKLASEATPRDTVVVYFSGHGAQKLSGPNEGTYLCPPGYKRDYPRETGLEAYEFTQLLQAIPAERILVIIDACHAGDAVTPKGEEELTKWAFGGPRLEKLAQGKGRVIIAASAGDEISMILGEYRNSLFTHFLLKGLKGAVDDQSDGLIRVLDLFSYLAKEVPKIRPQHPVLKTHTQNNFPVALRKGGLFKMVDPIGEGADQILHTKTNLTELNFTSLNGDYRQKIALETWNIWRESKKSAVIITGISGCGKSDRLARPLVRHAQSLKLIAVHVSVPDNALSAEAELCSLVINELKDLGENELAVDCENENGFLAIARKILKLGALLVVDEFQRLIEPKTKYPFPIWQTLFQKLATRAADKGCLWLISNREISPEWTEPFHMVTLPAPSVIDDQIRIVLEFLPQENAESKFPISRRVECVNRLGGNPRALRLLGNLLRLNALDDLLGPAQPTPEAPPAPGLVIALEQHMLHRATTGIEDKTFQFLERLTVLPQPSPLRLIKEISQKTNKKSEAYIRELQSCYLLETTGSFYNVHPVAREVLGPRLRERQNDWKQANLCAGTWHAVELIAAKERSERDANLALHLSGAHYHFINADARQKLRQILGHLETYINKTFGWNARIPATSSELDSAIDLLEIYLDKPSDAGVAFNYAKLLLLRNRPGDTKRALPYAERAKQGADAAMPWLLWAKIVHEVNGVKAAVTAVKSGINKVSPSKNIFSLYQFLGTCLAKDGNAEIAVEELRKGAGLDLGVENKERLIERAILIAASASDSLLLTKVRDELCQKDYPGQILLAEVLALEQQGNWEAAATKARLARKNHQRNLSLCHHDAIANLGVGAISEADKAINMFPSRFNTEARNGSQWVLALVAAQNSDLIKANKHFSIYAGSPQEHTCLYDLKNAIFLEWDQRVGTIGEANPALTVPILPGILIGVEKDIRRSQNGPPILRNLTIDMIVKEAPACSKVLPEKSESNDELEFIKDRNQCCPCGIEKYNSNTLSESLQSLLIKLYPQGPTENLIWSRAGGDISLLRLEGNGKSIWHFAIHLLTHGGGGENITPISLASMALEEFPHNDALRGLLSRMINGENLAPPAVAPVLYQRRPPGIE